MLSAKAHPTGCCPRHSLAASKPISCASPSARITAFKCEIVGVCGNWRPADRLLRHSGDLGSVSDCRNASIACATDRFSRSAAVSFSRSAASPCGLIGPAAGSSGFTSTHPRAVIRARNFGEKWRPRFIDSDQRMRHIRVRNHDRDPHRSQVACDVVHQRLIQNVPFQRGGHGCSSKQGLRHRHRLTHREARER